MLFIFSIVEILKEIFREIISIIITRINNTSKESDEPESEHRPSPLLVPVPPLHAAIVNSTTKENLTVSKYGNIVSEVCDDSCVVCLTVMEMHDDVRVMPNCRHVFHKDCIDAWIDKCKTSCPVCRSDLLPGRVEMPVEGGGGGVDPWRRERMMYLFGEDY